MKKKIILAFIIGAILSGTIVYAGTMIARDITFDNTKSQLKDSNNQNVDNVQDAIDALYTKASTTYDEYNGVTTYTPNTSTQTIPTNNKLLKSNITINPIPSSYKDLSTITTVTANDLVLGKTAYNSNGDLITGNLSNNCDKYDILLSASENTQTKIIDYIPELFNINGISNGGATIYFYYNHDFVSDKYFVLRNSSADIKDFANNTNFQIINNSIYYNVDIGWKGVTLHCTVCN